MGFFYIDFWVLHLILQSVSKKTTKNVKLWKIPILVINIVALCLSILIVLPSIATITVMSLGTGTTLNITEDDFNLEAATLILLTITSFIYLFVTNIVLTVLTAKKQFLQG